MFQTKHIKRSWKPRRARPIAGLIGLGGLSTVALALVGCGGGDVPKGRDGAETATASAETGQGTPRASIATKRPAEVVSTIAGDRMSALFGSAPLTKQTKPSPFRFAEVARAWGVDFTHFSGTMPEEKHFPTANGSGAALFDYDGDGLLDIYFASATTLPLGSSERGPNRLYRNLGNGRFEDATERSGLGFRGFCHGIIVGDVNNDGRPDVFLCNYDRNKLYLNKGDGAFQDVSEAAGVDEPGWSSGGAMLDYDNDGFLDIYVANYGKWVYPEDHIKVGDPEKNVWIYASPRTVRGARHLLYRNNGDLTFTNVYDKAITAEKEEVVGQKEEVDPETGAKRLVDVVERKRVPNPRTDGHGFGVVAADLNDDGLIDLFVANDMTPNFLFLNRGDGTFDDATEISGAAYAANGEAQSGMGADAEDVDGDGLPELFVTNFANEYNTLYQNLGHGAFFDNTAFFGLASDTRPFVGWGTGLVDFDGDGWPDLFITNGHVDDNRRLLGQPVDYEEIPLLFLNKAGKRFRLSTRGVGPYFDAPHVGRGAAFGDLDNDGDIDIVINEKDRPCAILRNDTPSANHWIRLVLQGTKSNRDAIGALVIVETGHQTIYRQRKGGASLESANDPRLTIGVGPGPIKRLKIVWPSGIVTEMKNVELDREHKIIEPKDAKPTMPHGEPRVTKRGAATAKAPRGRVDGQALRL